MKLAPAVRGRLTLVAEGRHLGFPTVSDDGSTVGFSRTEGRDKGVYLDRDGDQVKISDTPSYRVGLSADGSVAGFMAPDPSSPAFKQVMRWRQGQSECVSRDRAFRRPVQVSDDGETLVWQDFLNDSSGRRIQVKRWNDGLTTAFEGGYEPRLCGESGEIYFSGFNDHRLWKATKDGSVQPIPAPAGDLSDLAVDDQGRHGLLTVDSERGDLDLLIHDFDRNESRILSGEKWLDDYQPCISGDGSTVAFALRKGDYQHQTAVNIYREKDGELHPVTAGEASQNGENYGPQLSEDGSVLVWRWTNNSQDRIYKLEFSTGSD